MSENTSLNELPGIIEDNGEFNIQVFDAANKINDLDAKHTVASALLKAGESVTHLYCEEHYFTFIINKADKTGLSMLHHEINATKEKKDKGLDCAYPDFFSINDGVGNGAYALRCFMLHYPDYTLALPLRLSNGECGIFIKRGNTRDFNLVGYNPKKQIEKDSFHKFLLRFGLNNEVKSYEEKVTDINIESESYVWREIYNFFAFNRNPLVDSSLVELIKEIDGINLNTDDVER